MIELIVYPKNNNKRLINPSPFCSKTEIFLKLCKIEYSTSEFDGNPGKFPNKKLPVIKHESTTIPDSTLIQEYLVKKFNIDLDNHLSEPAKAEGFAFSKTLEEYFYWCLLHERWFIDKNWVKLKDDYFGHIPSFIRGFVTSMVRKSTLKSAIGHGLSRHTDEQILRFGKETLKNLAQFLQEKPFLLGDKLSSYDVTFYAFISSILHSEHNPVLRAEAEKHANLKSYDQRMYTLVFE